MQSVIPPTETLGDCGFGQAEQATSTSPPTLPSLPASDDGWTEIVDSPPTEIKLGPSMESVEKAFNVPLVSTPAVEHVDSFLPSPTISHIREQQSTFLQQSSLEHVNPTETTAAPIGASTSLIEDVVFVTPVLGESPSRKVSTPEILRSSQIAPLLNRQSGLIQRYKQNLNLHLQVFLHYHERNSTS